MPKLFARRYPRPEPGTFTRQVFETPLQTTPLQNPQAVPDRQGEKPRPLAKLQAMWNPVSAS